MQSSLPAGWLAFTGRELNPSDRYKRFQIIHPPFLDLAWRKGSFIVFPWNSSAQSRLTPLALIGPAHRSISLARNFRR